MVNFWDSSVWGWIALMGVLLGSILVANALKKKIPVLQESLIPTSVLGGCILLVATSIFTAVTHKSFYDLPLFGGNGTANLEVLTYHALALGFIASALKTSDQKQQKNVRQKFLTVVLPQLLHICFRQSLVFQLL